MKTKDLVEMAFKNLWRRKLRTFLTVLGVIIGTSSIVVMLSLGFGMTESYNSQIEAMGSLTNITVRKSYETHGATNNKNNKLDKKAWEKFKKIKNVVATMPIRESYGTIINGKYMLQAPIKGIPPESMELFDFKIAEGRLLNNSDDLSVVFGGAMKDSFYDPKATIYREPKVNLMRDRMLLTFDDNYGFSSMPGENKLQFKEYKIKTVGYLEPGDMDNDWGVYMPIETLDKLLKEKAKVTKERNQNSLNEYDTITVKANDMENVKEIQDKIKEMGFEAYSLNDILEEMGQITKILQAVLGGIGAISLLVAAIGITNTMIMSIYERTKEIGVMKVIGASLQDIKRLFLLESAVIGFLGGILGVGLSYLLSLIINFIIPSIMPGITNISLIPIWLSFVSIIFSSVIGVMAGFYPANRAMNLSALEALSTE